LDLSLHPLHLQLSNTSAYCFLYLAFTNECETHHIQLLPHTHWVVHLLLTMTQCLLIRRCLVCFLMVSILATSSIEWMNLNECSWVLLLGNLTFCYLRMKCNQSSQTSHLNQQEWWKVLLSLEARSKIFQFCLRSYFHETAIKAI
jgi:hypothetical protein